MLKQRIITAAIGIPLLLGLIWLGGWWLRGLLLLLALVGGYEYWRLVWAMPARSRLLWLVGGWAYILLGFLAFWGVRQEGGIIWLLLVIWLTDSAAYSIGRRWGRHKMAPRISPHKSWEGAIAGAGAGTVFGAMFATLALQTELLPALLISLAVSGLGQVGDLAESKVKRLAGVKDSGRLLPGHGGVLDRFDSLLLSSMFMYLFLLLI